MPSPYDDAVAGTGVGRGHRSRMWFGLTALATGCFTIGDGVHRIRGAADWAATWWPWLLLALALLNLLRTVIGVSSLIAPGLLAVVAVSGLALAHGISGRTLANLIIPAALVLVGLALLFPFRTAHRHQWTRVLATGRVRTTDTVGSRTENPQVVLRAIAGELRADLTGSFLDGSLTVQVTAVGGHVHLTVPRGWLVTIRSAGTVLTRVTDTGPRDTATKAADDEVGLHLLGLCGAVSLVRA
jgi:hypothetical protein